MVIKRKITSTPSSSMTHPVPTPTRKQRLIFVKDCSPSAFPGSWAVRMWSITMRELFCRKTMAIEMGEILIPSGSPKPALMFYARNQDKMSPKCIMLKRESSLPKWSSSPFVKTRNANNGLKILNGKID